jgi:hypothetical protein
MTLPGWRGYTPHRIADGELEGAPSPSPALRPVLTARLAASRPASRSAAPGRRVDLAGPESMRITLPSMSSPSSSGTSRLRIAGLG